MSPYRWTAVGALAIWAVLAGRQPLNAVESCGPPKPAAPQHITGGESFPPLPLPATPLRRTEKKREPRPPSLFAKVAYGTESQIEEGKKVSWPDWKTDPGDIETLLAWANSEIGINYGSIETSFQKFSYDPSDVPVLYLTGHNPPRITPDQAGRLRLYLQNGGTLVADACCGSPEFREAFEVLMKAVLPDRPLRMLPLEHPLFSDFYAIASVKYRNVAAPAGDKPLVMGADIGCRTAVFYFPRDVSCGWANHEHPAGERFAIEDARRMGANLVTYAIANYQLGRYLSSAKVYYQAGEKTRDEFVFGQLIHEGDWDPSPSGTANLLEYVDRETSINVQYKKISVAPDSRDIFNYPLLYLTGHYGFSLSEKAVENLRSFLNNGGIIFAESCCGRKEFDASLRREMARVLPGTDLRPLPLEHPLYRSFFTIERVSYSAYARELVKDANAPLLEAMELDETPAVIYSRFALANGWEQFDHPYSAGYDSVSALRIGTNILVYAMSH